MDVWMERVEEIINKQAVMETFVVILLCAVPIWLAIMIGIFIGWAWKPRWTGLVFLGLGSKLRLAWTATPGFGACRVWLAFTAFSGFSVGHRLLFKSRGRNGQKDSSSARLGQPDAYSPSASTQTVVAESSSDYIRPITGTFETENNVVMENDLEHLLHLLDGKDGEMAWQSMMERSTPNLAYQAWRHEPETGRVVYQTKTVFEDATPDLVRDFFWDDEFRPKWDPMLAYVKILEEFPHNGTMIVHWIKKRQRIHYWKKDMGSWENVLLCNKGVPYLALTRRDKPRRVDLYFSSWVIKPGDGQLSACEVTLIHYEDMGIPKDVAKLGVRHGMWGTVKKLHVGFRAYQNARKSEASLSRCALMARITTKISSDEGKYSLEPECNEEEKADTMDIQDHRSKGGIDWRWVVIGGAVVAVGLHTGVIGKALLLAAGHKAARRGGNSR